MPSPITQVEGYWREVGMSNFDAKSLIGEIDVLRSDEYANLPGCLNGADSIKLDQRIHEVMHMVIDLPASEEGKVVAISAVIQPPTQAQVSNHCKEAATNWTDARTRR